jgi:Glycosyltransferase sugar-binding region containing DXD motif
MSSANISPLHHSEAKNRTDDASQSSEKHPASLFVLSTTIKRLAISVTVAVVATVLSLVLFCPNQDKICILKGQDLPLELLVLQQSPHHMFPAIVTSSAGHIRALEKIEQEGFDRLEELETPPKIDKFDGNSNDNGNGNDSGSPKEAALEIPRVIYQTYNYKHLIPKKVDENLLKYAPEYERVIFDDSECLAFLEKHFHPYVAESFRYLKGAHKADLFRYALLYLRGGVYLDIKTELLMPLDEIFPATRKNSTSNNPLTYTCICWDDTGHSSASCIYQGIIATPRGNPVFLRAVQKILNVDKPVKFYHFAVHQMYGLISEQLEIDKLSEGLNWEHMVTKTRKIGRGKGSSSSSSLISGRESGGPSSSASISTSKSTVKSASASASASSSTGGNSGRSGSSQGKVASSKGDKNKLDKKEGKAPKSHRQLELQEPSEQSHQQKKVTDLSASDRTFLQRHRKFNFYLLQERMVPVSECPDGPDRYGYCYYVYDGDNRVIKTRYSDYPWHPRQKKNDFIPVCKFFGLYWHCSGTSS